jgi:hypothetical protein
MGIKEIYESFYYVRNLNTRKGFFQKDERYIIGPLGDYLKVIIPESLRAKMPKDWDISKVRVEYIENAIILLHINKIIDSISIMSTQSVDYANEKENEDKKEDFEERYSEYNVLMKELINSLNEELRVSLSIPTISFSRKTEGVILTESEVIDIDRRIYKKAYGKMEARLQVTITNY